MRTIFSVSGVVSEATENEYAVWVAQGWDAGTFETKDYGANWSVKVPGEDKVTLGFAPRHEVKGGRGEVILAWVGGDENKYSVVWLDGDDSRNMRAKVEDRDYAVELFLLWRDEGDPQCFHVPLDGSIQSVPKRVNHIPHNVH